MQRATKWFLGLLGSVAILFGGFVILHGSLQPASVNSWLSAGNMSVARAGAATVLLQDGRLLITGGNGASGALASTEILDPSNGFTAGPPMSIARSNHVAVLLLDGRVLVAGGTDASGRASQSAELFDPVANSWSASGPLMVGRSGATATLLPSGQVLIAGGTANGAALASLELFDPNSNTFSLVAGTLSSARENHAAALLPDGRVLIAGGWDGTTVAPVPPATTATPNVLASTDIFDPSTGTVAPGPALTSPRMSFTATTALDGNIAAIGGTDGQTDLASIDVLAPAAGAFALSGAQLTTARQGHLAFLLPHNGNILVVGGTSSGAAISSTELYTPWTGATSVTGAMASARSGATGSPLSNGAPNSQNDGILVVAGGADSSGNTLASAEAYGFAWIKTDASDYSPGTTVYVSGGGWQPGETLNISLVESPLIDTHGPYTVTVGSDGTFTSQPMTSQDASCASDGTPCTFVPDLHDVSVQFALTAVGSASQAQTTFTDSTATVSGTVTNANTSAAISGATVTCTSGCNTSQSTTTASDGTYSFSGSNHLTFSTSPHSITLTASATGFNSGTLTFSVTNGESYTGENFSLTPVAAATTITDVSASGPYGGTATLTATLTSGGNAVPNESISFLLNNVSVGMATTNSSGVATLSGVSLAGYDAGTYLGYVSASFAGDSTYAASGPVTGPLTVTQNTTSVTVSNATATFGDTSVTLTATVTDTTDNTITVNAGTLTFYVNAVAQTPVDVVNGTATLSYSLSGVNAGTYILTAKYNGSTNFSPGTTANLGAKLTVLPKTAIASVTVTPLYYSAGPPASTSSGNSAPGNCSGITGPCQQYSDEVNFTVTVSPGVINSIYPLNAVNTCVAAGDNVPCVNVRVAGATVLQGFKDYGPIALTLDSGTGNLVGHLDGQQILQMPGPYTATVSPISTVNPNFLLDTNTGRGSLTVVQEDAAITYTGAEYFSSTNNTMSLTVSYTLQDATATGTGNPIYDLWAGDITKAKAALTLLDASNNTVGTCNPNVIAVSGEVDPNNGLPSTATITCTFTNVPVPGNYSLSAYPGNGSYYTLSAGDTGVILIATANGGTGFITGGGHQSAGYLNTADTPGSNKYMAAGLLKPADNTKVNFGFEAQYKKNSKLQGGVNIVVRSTCLPSSITGYTPNPTPPGNVCVYQIKVPQGQLQSLTETLSPAPPYASMGGNANIYDVTGPTAVQVANKATLVLQMYDIGDPGPGANVDPLSIQVIDSQVGLWFSNNWSGSNTVISLQGVTNPTATSTTAPVINGGNIQVH
jgi:Bacterial Ig-like domain (group 3)/Kelch motif